MKWLERCVSLALAVLFALAVSAGCADDNPSDVTTETQETGNSVTETADTRIYPDLPEVTYDGSTFTFMHYESDTATGSLNNHDLYAEAESGDTINDAVYRRNSTIEEKYDIKIALQLELFSSMPAKIGNLVKAGDDSIDVYYPFGASLPGGLFTQKIFYNLYDLNYIDLEKPWWDQNCIKDLSIGGRCYFTTTDINIIDKAATSLMVFNKQLATDYNCPDLYKLVNDGAWTIGKLSEVSKGVTTDLNGDSQLDVNDVFGLVGADTFTVALYHALGGNYTVQDENGYPVANFDNEKSYSIFDKIFSVMYDPNVYVSIDWLGYPLAPEAVELFFSGNHSLFSWVIFESLDRLRNTDADFGILPLPKYDEQQSRYYHYVSMYATSFLCVPLCVSNPDRTGVILEALAAESEYTLIPAYYETVLKGKYSRDNESEAMVDIILKSRVYSLADIAGIGSVGAYVLRIVSTNKGSAPSVASGYKKIDKAFQKSIEKYIKMMTED